MTVKNLWGAMHDIENLRPPHEIIFEQGRLLKEMTKDLLELKIERKTSNTIFNYDIYISAPSLSHKQRIFRLTHDFKLYPANLYDEQSSSEYKCADQDEFEKNLGAILSSKETMTTIGALMAQSRFGNNDVFV